MLQLLHKFLELILNQSQQTSKRLGLASRTNTSLCLSRRLKVKRTPRWHYRRILMAFTRRSSNNSTSRHYIMYQRRGESYQLKDLSLWHRPLAWRMRLKKRKSTISIGTSKTSSRTPLMSPMYLIRMVHTKQVLQIYRHRKPATDKAK